MNRHAEQTTIAELQLGKTLQIQIEEDDWEDVEHLVYMTNKHGFVPFVKI